MEHMVTGEALPQGCLVEVNPNDGLLYELTTTPPPIIQWHPWIDSFYMDCLMELMAQEQTKGSEFLKLTDVDALVVERSKSVYNYQLREGAK